MDSGSSSSGSRRGTGADKATAEPIDEDEQEKIVQALRQESIRHVSSVASFFGVVCGLVVLTEMVVAWMAKAPRSTLIHTAASIVMHLWALSNVRSLVVCHNSSSSSNDDDKSSLSSTTATGGASYVRDVTLLIATLIPLVIMIMSMMDNTNDLLVGEHQDIPKDFTSQPDEDNESRNNAYGDSDIAANDDLRWGLCFANLMTAVVSMFLRWDALSTMRGIDDLCLKKYRYKSL